MRTHVSLVVASDPVSDGARVLPGQSTGQIVDVLCHMMRSTAFLKQCQAPHLPISIADV